MQMVANGYGVTLLPDVAASDEARDSRVKLLRFAGREPARTIGLAWRRTSPRQRDFAALGRVIIEALGISAKKTAVAKYFGRQRARSRAAQP
jgi:LysR family hydrogen peroxide-inducible transcriptional activator